MNPDTKTTESQIKTICARHDIEHASSQRITTGFSHEVHKLNNDLILKVYRHGSDDKFNAERAVLSANLDFPRPNLIASDNSRKIIDRDYVIMSFVEGYSLGSRWHLLNDGQRQKVVEDMSAALKQINAMSPDGFVTPANGQWPEILYLKVKKLTTNLLAKGIITRSQADQTLEIFQMLMPFLGTDRLYPVNWDVHFDNQIVNDQNRVVAMIDFEHVELAALDYPLFMIKEMASDPCRYMTEDNEKHAKQEDYSKVWGWYQRYYPEMFEFDNLEKRIEVYETLNVLELMQEWSHNPELQEKFKKFTGER